MMIRTLAASERGALKSFYLGLCPEDRRKRFCCSISDESVSKYVDGLNFSQHLVLGAYGDHSELIGLAELAPGDKAREMAFSVRPDMRSKHIGTRLMERLLLHASMGGVRKVFVMFLSDNTPMRRMARRAGMPVETDGGESYAARELLNPSREDMLRWKIEEAAADGGGFGAAMPGFGPGIDDRLADQAA